MLPNNFNSQEAQVMEYRKYRCTLALADRGINIHWLDEHQEDPGNTDQLKMNGMHPSSNRWQCM